MFGRFFAVPPSGLENAVADLGRDLKTTAMRRALFVEKDVSRDNAWVFAVEPRLKTRFKVTVEVGERRRRGVKRRVGCGARSEKRVDFIAKILLDKKSRFLVTAVEKNRADDRLRRVRKDNVGDRLDAFADEKETRQFKAFRDPRAGLAADDRALDAGKLAFVQGRKRSVKQVGDGETERRVAKELEPLVRIDMSRGVGRVRQRFFQERTIGEAVTEATLALGEIRGSGGTFHKAKGGATARRLERNGERTGKEGRRTRLKKQVGEGRQERQRRRDEERNQDAAR